jgi:glycosyltransferase involved in cell wall biosynthesis
MKIAHLVESYWPSIGGMQEVVKQLSEHLVTFGHEVHVLTGRHQNRTDERINGVDILEFDVQGSHVKTYSGNDVEKFREYLRGSHYDVVVCFAAQQWATDLFLEIIEEIRGKKVFVPTGFSGFFDPRYSKYFERMKNWMLKFDLCVFLSDNYRDIDFYKSIGGLNSVLIPNGADEKEFLPDSHQSIREKFSIPSQHKLILMVGSFTGIKGHQEAISIFKKSSFKDATFLIVGNVSSRKSYLWARLRSAFSIKRIIITQLSRQETVAAYKQADLFLFPSNLECSPIVLFEACAARTAFLCSDVGNSKEIIQWTNGGMCLPTRLDRKGRSRAVISKSAQMLTAILGDEGLRERLASEGFESWLRKFTWKRIAASYERSYLNLLEKP